jgi:peptidoglycan/xylan/chitin deacetylase (PgdA/CDA1 family)
MLKYFIKTPWWLKRMYPNRVWGITTKEKNIYLTFDDGPDPVATTFVLDELKKFNARATFFCIGKNVESHPELYDRILSEGHQTGNHSQNHLNGWKTKDEEYYNDIQQAAGIIKSSLFRPPYGRLRSSQAEQLANFKIIMWDVLSADFDLSVSKETCLRNVIENARNGSIVVFHDSQKAWSKLQYSLPQVLEHFSKKDYKFLPLFV